MIVHESEAPPQVFESHELATLFPAISDEELHELAASIKENGQREPILLFDGRIIDGRNRYAACLIAGVAPKVKEIRGSVNLVDLVIDANLRRRHLDTAQRAMIAAELCNRKRGGKQEDTNSGIPLISQSEAAEKLGVSVDSVKQAVVVKNSGDAALIEETKNGKKKLNAAVKMVRTDRAKSGEETPKRKNTSAGPPPVLTHDQEYPPSQPINVRFSRKDTSNLVAVLVKQFTQDEITALCRELAWKAAQKTNPKVEEVAA